MNPLALVGGGITGGPIHSQSGDASAGLTAPLQYNAAFNVGSGATQNQSAAQPGGGGSGGTLAIVAVVIGIASLALAAYAIAKK